MSIPEVRARLRELAEEHGIEELNELADAMYRRSPAKRAPNRSPKLTPELAEAPPPPSASGRSAE